MREFTLATTIAARPEDVWDVLADFERYPEWHPLVERLTVTTHWSTQLKVVIRIARRIALRGSLLEFDPPTRMQWDGRHALWGMLNPKYSLEITSDPGVTVVTQKLKVGGLLGRLAPGLLSSLPDALAESAYALKQRAERRPELRAA
jgi:hypothetical protein